MFKKTRERHKLEALKKKQEQEEERMKKMEEEKRKKQEELKRLRFGRFQTKYTLGARLIYLLFKFNVFAF